MNFTKRRKKEILKRVFLITLISTLFMTCLPSTSMKVEAGISDNVVTYTPYAIGKGAYSTPIWEQHTIWPKKSSAANHGCGICVTAMALRLNGVMTNPNIVLKETKRSVKKCNSFKGKKAAAYIQSKGIKAVVYKTNKMKKKASISIMKQALMNGKTVMLVVQGRPFSSGIHWILLTGFTRDGRVVVANSSYGCNKVCKKAKKQYQIVTWNQIQKKMVRFSKSWSRFVVVGNDKFVIGNNQANTQ